MKHVHFFRWNIPAENQLTGQTNRYINIIAETNMGLYSDGRPIVYITPANISFSELMQVKDWYTAHEQILECAEKYFAEIARAEKIAEARATLIAENEPTG